MSATKLTKDDREFIAQVKSLGCIVAFDSKINCDPCWGVIEFHHLLRSGRRMGHRFGIGLCQKHHQHGKISIGHGVKTFEKHYGKQIYLLAKIYDKLGLELPTLTTKIVKREYAE